LRRGKYKSWLIVWSMLRIALRGLVNRRAGRRRRRSLIWIGKEMMRVLLMFRV